MRSKSKWAMNGAAAGALMLALATPVFAQSRGDWNRNDSNRYDSRNDTTQQSQRSARRDGASRDNGQYRENERCNSFHWFIPLDAPLMAFAAAQCSCAGTSIPCGDGEKREISVLIAC